MDSIASSGPSAVLKAAARVAAEGGVVATVAALAAGRIWTAGVETTGLTVGVAAAWAASSVSVAWLLWARDCSTRAFWWAFGGGMALRAGVLGALVAWGLGRETVSLEALLLSYVFALLLLLLSMEMRHLRIK